MGNITNSNTTNTTGPIVEGGHAATESTVYIATFLLLVMITLSMNLAHYLKHRKFTYFGETAIYIIFGCFVSALWTSISFDPTNSAIKLDSHFFSLVLLPPIIFEGGYSIQRSMFFTNILPILGLAMFGGFFSTFVVSILMYCFSRIVADEGWTLIESLVFGALISSTDPVTVLSLLPADVDKRLYMFIFGESALNDAVAIILYRFFVSLQADADNLSIFPFFFSVIASAGVFLGSFVVGVVFALIYAKVTKHVWINGYEGAIYEMVMLVVCAYCSYLLAEVLGLTGIISIFFTGITMAHYATPNMTELTKKTVKVVLRVVCMIFEGIIFLYFGLGLMSFQVNYDMFLVFFAIIAILVGRVHVFLVCGLTKYLPGSTAVPMNQQTLVWFSGLRGAVAFALAVSFLEEPNFPETIKESIFATTVMVILFTVMVLGTLTPYMLQWLLIVSPEIPDDSKGEHSALPSDPTGHAISEPEKDVDQTVTEHDLTQPVFGWLFRFDAKYIRPHFSIQTEETVKVMEAIRRHDSKRESSMIHGRSSFFASGIHLKGVSIVTDDIVLSPMNMDNSKNKEEDQERLIRKSVPVRHHEEDDHISLNNKEDMDAVSLN